MFAAETWWQSLSCVSITPPMMWRCQWCPTHRISRSEHSRLRSQMCHRRSPVHHDPDPRPKERMCWMLVYSRGTGKSFQNRCGSYSTSRASSYSINLPKKPRSGKQISVSITWIFFIAINQPATSLLQVITWYALYVSLYSYLHQNIVYNYSPMP